MRVVNKSKEDVTEERSGNFGHSSRHTTEKLLSVVFLFFFFK